VAGYVVPANSEFAGWNCNLIEHAQEPLSIMGHRADVTLQPFEIRSSIVEANTDSQETMSP